MKSVDASARRRSGARMSTGKRLAIEQDCARLIALYANLNDEARWEELAALYTDEGCMTRPSAPDAEIRGRAAILAAFVSRPARKTRHVCANIVIEVLGATEARGTSAMLLFTREGPPLIGSFHDHFVLTDLGWRFSERRGSLSFQD